MENIKIIITDLDNTILRKDKTISAYTTLILKKCLEYGFIIAFATARPERATRQWQVGGTPIYIISNNGATIMLDGKEIRNIPISDNTKHDLLKRFADNEDVDGITVEAGDFLYTNDKEYKTWANLINDAGWNPVYHDFLTPISEKICKISVNCKSLEIIMNILHDYPDLHIYPNNGEYWHQITHIAASKINAIQYLSKLSNVSINDIIAFGDDYNDVDMIKKCGVGVAVANAVSDAKQAADFICESNDNDGVAKFIEKFLLHREWEKPCTALNPLRFR